MFVRSRRAAAPVSNSASTTIFPLTMCRPPAKRSIVATSALRQHVFVIWVLESSAFTCAVIAMRQILSRSSTTLDVVISGAHDARVRRGELHRVVSRGAVPAGDVGEDELRAERPGDPLQVVEIVADALLVGKDGVHPQVRRVLGEHGE